MSHMTICLRAHPLGTPCRQYIISPVLSLTKYCIHVLPVQTCILLQARYTDIQTGILLQTTCVAVQTSASAQTCVLIQADMYYSVTKKCPMIQQHACSCSTQEGKTMIVCSSSANRWAITNVQKARPLQDGRPGRKDSVTDCFDNNATALFGQRTVWTTSAHCLDNVAMHCPLKP